MSLGGRTMLSSDWTCSLNLYRWIQCGGENRKLEWKTLFSSSKETACILGLETGGRDDDGGS